VLLCAASLLAGCVQTTYTAHDGKPEQWSPFERQVRYRLESIYYADPPTCAFVLPAIRTSDAAVAALVEPAIARHLSQKVPSVIGPMARDRLTRQNAVDLNHDGDRRHFARQTKCPAYLAWRLLHRGDDYVIVWAQRRIGLELKLIRASDESLLWQASHTALRWHGGLPISPASAVFAAADAARLQLDRDVLPSLIDDALRRMFVTLPELH
jgi:hypothetical protein